MLTCQLHCKGGITLGTSIPTTSYFCWLVSNLNSKQWRIRFGEEWTTAVLRSLLVREQRIRCVSVCPRDNTDWPKPEYKPAKQRICSLQMCMPASYPVPIFPVKCVCVCVCSFSNTNFWSDSTSAVRVQTKQYTIQTFLVDLL